MAKAKAVETGKGFVPVIKKAVTLPVLKMVIDKPNYIRVDSAIVQSKIKVKLAGQEQKEPAHIMNVTDLETGDQKQIVVATVLKGIIEENYPDESYVGLGFQIIKHAKPSGKAYHLYTVAELDLGNA